MPIPTPTSTRTADDTVRTLVGEFFEEKQRERSLEIARQRAPRRRSPALTIFAVTVCAAIWILPSFRQDVYFPSDERVDASARMQVFLAAQRVMEYQRTTGQLPVDLSLAGVDTTGITYRRGNDSLFEIRASVGNASVAYTSTMNPTEFLGTTFQVLGSTR